MTTETETTPVEVGTEECQATVYHRNVDVQCLRTDPHGEYADHCNGDLTWRKMRRIPTSWGMDPVEEEARRRDVGRR